MDPIVSIIVLLVLGILLALLIWAIAVATRSMKEHRGRVILLGVGLFFIIGLLFFALIMEYWVKCSALGGANFAFSQAASEARLYELVTDYELADSAARAKLYPEVLKICQNAGFNCVIPTSYSVPSCINESAKEIGWEIKDDSGIRHDKLPLLRTIDASGVATLWILNECINHRYIVGKFRCLISRNGTLSSPDWIFWDNARISSLLRNNKVPGMQSRNAQYYSSVNRLIAYSLLSWNVKRQRYDTAFDKLQVALGEEWLDSGVVDNWWKKNLPPRVKDHLIFGYVLYKSGHRDKALREYRLAKGSAKSEYIMQREYEKEFRF